MQRIRSRVLHALGEKRNQPIQLSFAGAPKLDFPGSRVTSDGGFLRVREWEGQPGFAGLIAQRLTDSRLPPADPLHQSISSGIAGYAE